MKRHTWSLLVGASVAIGQSAAFAQQSPAPPIVMPKVADEPGWLIDSADDERSKQAHAPDLDLERPALSQHVTPAMMGGMDTDMNDAGPLHRIWIENLERVQGPKAGGAWDAQGWSGGDFDKLWLKTEGFILAGKEQDAEVEALWAHAILPYWDAQLGVRDDFSDGPSRTWAAFGVEGISPYWFDVELTGYVGEEGRTAARLKTEYDLYLTQQLIIKPEIELNLYGKPDRAREIGAGLSDGQLELRLRYEFTRRFAPYLGYVYDRKFAGSAALAHLTGDPSVSHRTVVGLEFFF